MATVTGYNAARMKQIEDETVVNGHVDAGHHLILTTREGTEIDAGDVSSVPRVAVEDSSSVDLTLTGAGSDLAPWKIKADVKTIPANKVDSGVFDLARIPDMVFAGLLSGDYRGQGSATVQMDGGTTLTNVDWVVPYIPWGSRRVSLMKSAGRWVITGQTQYESITGGHKQIKLTSGANWFSYNRQQGIMAFADGPYATQLPSGLVVLSGLLRYINGVPGNSTTIASGLPVGMRPAADIIHYVNNADTSKYLWIRKNGAISVGENYVSNGYISLDGIAFWPEGVGTWTNIGSDGSSFGPNFEARIDAGWVPPGYWKDPYGFVWFRGVVQVKTATSSDNTLLANLPVSHRSGWNTGGTGGAYRHILTVGNATTAGIGIGGATDPLVNDGLLWKTNSPGSVGSWISLASVVYPTADSISYAGNVWRNVEGYTNGWTHYAPGSFPVPAFMRREDGLAIGQGLIGSGTSGGANSRAFGLDREFWNNNGRLIIDTLAANSRARLDMSSIYEQDSDKNPGNVNVINGSNQWLSLDGVKYVTSF